MPYPISKGVVQVLESIPMEMCLRRARTTFDEEYLEAHAQAFQATLPLETFHKYLNSKEKSSDMAQKKVDDNTRLHINTELL